MHSILYSNVHNTSGPRCPFCAARAAINWLPMWLPAVVCGVLVAIATDVALRRHPLPWRWWRAVLGFLAAQAGAFVLTELALGIAFVLAAPAYGYFLGVTWQ